MNLDDISKNGKTDWSLVSKIPNLEEPFIHRFRKNVNWDLICKNQTLSIPFIKKHLQYLKPYLLTSYQELSEEFINQHTDKLDWYWMTSRQVLSEPFIIKNMNKLSMKFIGAQVLSEKFIKDNIKKLSLRDLLCHQIFSEDFLEYLEDYAKEEFSYSYMLQFQNLSENYLENNLIKLEPYKKTLSLFQNISEEFIIEHRKLLDIEAIHNSRMLSFPTLKKLKLKPNINNWHYLNPKQKKARLEKLKKYDMDNTYIYGYKMLRYDSSSILKPAIKYNNIQQDVMSDGNPLHSEGRGLYFGTIDNCKLFIDTGKLVEVKSNIEDITSILRYNFLRTKQLYLI